MEAEIAGLFRDLLRVSDVSIHDSFFELGGHSILATQMLSRLRDALGVELPLRRLFETPTVAAWPSGSWPGRPPPEAVLPPLTRVERGDALRCRSPGAALLPGPPRPRLAGLQHRRRGPAARRPRPRRALESLDEIRRRHESLRTTSSSGTGFRDANRGSGGRRDPFEDLSRFPPERREAEARRAASRESLLPFDLGGGPVSRTRLLRLDDEDTSCS